MKKPEGKPRRKARDAAKNDFARDVSKAWEGVSKALKDKGITEADVDRAIREVRDRK